ncbi:hypothetical protein FS837_006328, partial [Tulasnella sp. UAMH 9824]
APLIPLITIHIHYAYQIFSYDSQYLSALFLVRRTARRRAPTPPSSDHLLRAESTSTETIPRTFDQLPPLIAMLILKKTEENLESVETELLRRGLTLPLDK